MAQHVIDLSLDSVRAVYLTAEDLKVAASILYNAYFDDPLFVDIFDSEREGYESRLRSAIREELHAFWTARQPMVGLYDEKRLLAVACLIAPDAAFGAGRYWHWRLKMLLTAGFLGTKHMIEKEERVRECMPASNYHMLSFIGVHPDYQDKGLGHILMNAIDSVMSEDERSEGVGVYVTLPKCLSFFRGGHYDHVCELEFSHITGYVMFRPRPNNVRSV
ncbi:GNAT family N-acetyltransferase [Alteromonas oceanisediminis]|uniref:GNAT family N-acetyltransferase n=1 Tax=Alteromonas oceanisediminis TaxID=2836180 RepID=UPI001BD96275|nr:GNAT family N-acetyltransferase [Alteromonas oceanisediminis]MBT0585022.1 GNAT family N-acetyltransferase [Alteromonas oceanisediminis]